MKEVIDLDLDVMNYIKNAQPEDCIFYVRRSGDDVIVHIYWDEESLLSCLNSAAKNEGILSMFLAIGVHRVFKEGEK